MPFLPQKLLFSHLSQLVNHNDKERRRGELSKKKKKESKWEARLKFNSPMTPNLPQQGTALCQQGSIAAASMSMSDAVSSTLLVNWRQQEPWASCKLSLETSALPSLSFHLANWLSILILSFSLVFRGQTCLNLSGPSLMVKAKSLFICATVSWQQCRTSPPGKSRAMFFKKRRNNIPVLSLHLHY